MVQFLLISFIHSHNCPTASTTWENSGGKKKMDRIYKNDKQTHSLQLQPSIWTKCTFSWFFFIFHWCYSPLWTLACLTMSLHFVLSLTISLHLLTLNTWRSLSTSSLHPFLGLPLRLVPSSSWFKTFLGILFSSILSRWPSQLILYPFIHFTIFSPLLNSSSPRFVLLGYVTFDIHLLWRVFCCMPYMSFDVVCSNHFVQGTTVVQQANQRICSSSF